MTTLRIILADDHPFILLGLRSTLAIRTGVAVVGQAHTPAALIALLQSMPCDVLVIDLSMPEPAGTLEDGLGLVQCIRRDWPALRVVVATAQTDLDVLRALVSDDAVSVFSKADPLDELAQAIARSAAGVRYLGRSVVAALGPVPDDGNAPAFAPESQLSGCQSEILRRLVCGESIGEIAVALGCHRRTVTRQKRAAMERLGVATDPDLLAHVRAHGMPCLESDQPA